MLKITLNPVFANQLTAPCITTAIVEMRGSRIQELDYETGNQGFNSTGSLPEVQER